MKFLSMDIPETQVEAPRIQLAARLTPKDFHSSESDWKDLWKEWSWETSKMLGSSRSSLGLPFGPPQDSPKSLGKRFQCVLMLEKSKYKAQNHRNIQYMPRIIESHLQLARDIWIHDMIFVQRNSSNSKHQPQKTGCSLVIVVLFHAFSRSVIVGLCGLHLLICCQTHITISLPLGMLTLSALLPLLHPTIQSFIPDATPYSSSAALAPEAVSPLAVSVLRTTSSRWSFKNSVTATVCSTQPSKNHSLSVDIQYARMLETVQYYVMCIYSIYTVYTHISRCSVYSTLYIN